MIDISAPRFEQMVGEAIDGLPPKLGRQMRNVAVVIDDDSPASNLLGLYRGVPMTERTSHYAGVMPDQITIYRQAICAICGSDAEVVEEVRRTVIHAIGHHFGIGDERLHELGW